LCWRKPNSTNDESAVELASSGADHCVRVFEIRDR
jgi:elongator complex protein 2